jgi:hypothetical protein
MQFLGLRVCNLPGFRTIGLPSDKLESLMGLLEKFETDYRPGSAVAPKELASLLGQLNFAAQVVDGGSVFLDRMYSQFRGVIVDWKRGMVSAGGCT